MGTSSRNGTNILISIIVAVVIVATIVVTAWACSKARALVVPGPQNKNTKEWIEANIISETIDYHRLSDGSYIRSNDMDNYLANKFNSDVPYTMWYTSQSLVFDKEGKVINKNSEFSQNISLVYKDAFGRGQASSADAASSYLSTLVKYSNTLDREKYYDSEKQAIDNFKDYLAGHHNYSSTTWYSYDNTNWSSTEQEARNISADNVPIDVRDITCYWNETYCDLDANVARSQAVAARRATVRYVNNQYQYTNIYGNTYYLLTSNDVSGFIDSDVEGSISFKNEFSHDNFATVYSLESLARDAYSKTLTNSVSQTRYSHDGVSSYANLDGAIIAFKASIKDSLAGVTPTRWYKSSLLPEVGYVKENKDQVIADTVKVLEFQMAIKDEQVLNFDAYNLKSIYRYGTNEHYYNTIDDVFAQYKKDVHTSATEVSKVSYKLVDTGVWFDTFDECRDYWVSQIKN